MRKLFELDGDEVKRILSLHEESTKKQYLNVLNEQKPDNLMPGQPDNPANVEIKNAVNDDSKKKSPYNGVNYTLQNPQKFSNAVGGKTFEVPSGTILTVDQTNKKLNIGKYLKFGCSPITVSKTPFYYTSYDGKTNYGNVGSALTNVLRKRYCKGTELKSNEEILGKKSEIKQKVDGNLPKVGGGQVTLNPQQMVDTIKQVQQSIGIQSPTGQITDADVDLIIAKLSETPK